MRKAGVVRQSVSGGPHASFSFTLQHKPRRHRDPNLKFRYLAYTIDSLRVRLFLYSNNVVLANFRAQAHCRKAPERAASLTFLDLSPKSTVRALNLQFSIHSFQPHPLLFFHFDHRAHALANSLSFAIALAHPMNGSPVAPFSRLSRG